VLHRGVSAEAMAFLPKPFTPETLASRVRAVLDAPVAALAG
jgi:DNA-binding response OmpR family regulator